MDHELIGYAVGAVGLALAVLRDLAARRERRRKRPVVIANEQRGRHWNEGPLRHGSAADAYLTNESEVQAVNVRFGIQLNGIRYPYKHNPADPEASRINVVAPNGRAPESGAYEISIPNLFDWSGGGDPDPGRVYWCRYRSLSGEVWETRNPAARHKDFTLHRVHMVRLTAWREERGRRRTDRQAEKRIHEGVRELNREAAEHSESDPEQPTRPER